MTDQSHVFQTRTVPTMYFIGVTTGQSLIMDVFPKWSEILELGAEIVGYDAPINAPAEDYRAIVHHIKIDPLSLGALVTTHKIDLLKATRDMFDYLDSHAELTGEISCISKSGNLLAGHAKDPIASGLAWQAFNEPGEWGRTNGHVLCLGAGGAAVAISLYVSRLPDPADRPRKFIVVDRSQARLDSLRAIHVKIDTDVVFEYICNDDPVKNDVLMGELPPGSLVINATGMGKDTPGSPVTDQGVFPLNGKAWELNYRGALDFVHQARRQIETRGLHVEDGWVYFLHGWSQAIAEVFDIDLTPEIFAALEKAASSLRS